MWFLRLGNKNNTASAWLSPLGCLPLEVILYFVSKSRLPGKATHRCSNPQPQLRSQQIANIYYQTLKWTSLQVVPAPLSLPAEAPRIWSTDMSSLLCLIWIPGHRNHEKEDHECHCFKPPKFQVIFSQNR